MPKMADPKHPYHSWQVVAQDGRRVKWKCVAGKMCNATRTTFNGEQK